MIETMKFISKKIKDYSGVTLVEVLIVMAIMGGLAVVMMNMTKQQNVMQKKAESSFEVSTLHSGVVSTLLTAEACTYTLAPLGDISGAVSGTINLNAIRNRQNSVLYNTTTNYNNLVTIPTMEIRDLVAGPLLPSGKKFGDLNLIMTYEKTAKILPGENKTTRSEIVLRVELNAANTVTNCYSATENAIDEGRRQACESIGGTVNPATYKCDMAPYPALVDANIGVSTKFLDDYMINNLDLRYVNVIGDIMTGNLNMNGGSRVMVNSGGGVTLTSANMTSTGSSWNLSGSPVTANNSNFTLNSSSITLNNGYVYSDLYISVSDKRLKKKFKSLEKTSPKIYDLKTYEFVWRRNNKKDYGFIAQEVEELFPELVQNNRETGYKGVQYVSLIPLVVEEMKKLKHENEELKRENQELRRDIDEIRDYLKLKKVE